MGVLIARLLALMRADDKVNIVGFEECFSYIGSKNGIILVIPFEALKSVVLF